MAERKVDIGIIGAATTGLTAYPGVREHTDRLVLIEAGPHGAPARGSAGSRASC